MVCDIGWWVVVCVSVCPFGCGDCPIWWMWWSCGCVWLGHRGPGGEVTILSEYWHTTPRVLVHCPRVLSEYSQSTATVLPEYWCSTPRVLAQHSLEQCHSTTRVLVQYSKSTGTVLPEHLGSAHPRVLTQHKRPTPRVLPEWAYNSPRAASLYWFQYCPSTVTDHKPNKETPTCHHPKHKKHRNWQCGTTHKQAQRLKTPAQCCKMALKIGSLLRRLLCILWKRKFFFTNLK